MTDNYQTIWDKELLKTIFSFHISTRGKTLEEVAADIKGGDVGVLTDEDGSKYLMLIIENVGVEFMYDEDDKEIKIGKYVIWYNEDDTTEFRQLPTPEEYETYISGRAA